MKQDEIIDKDEVLKMAKEAGFHIYNNCADGIVPDLEAFAKLVAVAAASKERERIIAMEKDLAASPALFATMKEWSGYKHGIETFIAAVRARGESK